MIRNFNDEINFPHKLLLTQVSKIRKAFTNDSPANIKSSEAQLSKILPFGEVILGASILVEITSLADPIRNSFVKKLKNTGTKKQINIFL